MQQMLRHNPIMQSHIYKTRRDKPSYIFIIEEKGWVEKWI